MAAQARRPVAQWEDVQDGRRTRNLILLGVGVSNSRRASSHIITTREPLPFQRERDPVLLCRAFRRMPGGCLLERAMARLKVFCVIAKPGAVLAGGATGSGQRTGMASDVEVGNRCAGCFGKLWHVAACGSFGQATEGERPLSDPRSFMTQTAPFAQNRT